MRGRGAGRVIGVLGLALLFGILASVLKGNGTGVRDGLGNLSAPWVIVPLLAGATASGGQIGRGAGVGLLATLLALTGFYLTNAFVLDLGSHSTVANIGLTLNVGSPWFKAGAASGPVMGALGALARRHGWVAVSAIAAFIVMFEPFAIYAYLHLRPAAGFAAGGSAWRSVYLGEGVSGLVGVIVLLALALPRLKRLRRL